MMSNFEPPRYVASLIQAVNDGAKTAQTGLLALAAFGIYLLAVAAATTDEDLLLNHTTNIAQFGVQLPPKVTFGIAPWIFVALHVFTLIRYDMLMVNLRHLSVELKTSVVLEKDRERCLQLLANVEFIAATIVPKSSPLYSKVFGPVFCTMIGAFPIAILLIDQISALRYQSSTILWSQRFVVLADLTALAWFFWRTAIGKLTLQKRSLDWVLQWAALFFAFPLAVVMNVFWLQIPGSEQNIRCKPNQVPQVLTSTFWSQPLDQFLCPEFGLGCRFLKVENRVLYAEVLPDGLARMRIENGFSGDESQAAVVGTYLVYRSLNYVDFDFSELYNAKFRFARLSWISMYQARAPGADFSFSRLPNADFRFSNLSGANFQQADVIESNFGKADLSGANFSGADVSDDTLTGANIKGANFSHACYDQGTKFPNGFAPISEGLIVIGKNEPCPGVDYQFK